MKYLQWILIFPIGLLIEVFCLVTNPIACIFVTTKERTDKVKRFNKQVVTMPRDYLFGWFYLWQTHDNAVDEGWYGLYDIGLLKGKTQEDYNKSKLIRWYARVWWLTRNTAYGFHYVLFSKPKEPVLYIKTRGDESKGFWYEFKLFKSSFQLKANIPIYGKRHLSINIGWKEHTFMPRKIYANRIIGFRNYK